MGTLFRDYKFRMKLLRDLVPSDTELKVLFNIVSYMPTEFTMSMMYDIGCAHRSTAQRAMLTLTNKGVLSRKAQSGKHVVKGDTKTDFYTYTLNSNYNIESIERSLTLRTS